MCPSEDNEDELIAYQFGENSNRRAFVAINLATDRGAALSSIIEGVGLES